MSAPKKLESPADSYIAGVIEARTGGSPPESQHSLRGYKDMARFLEEVSQQSEDNNQSWSEYESSNG